MTSWDFRQHVRLAVYCGKWLLLAAPLGIAAGSAVALFLTSLDWVTRCHWQYPWLLYGLPLAGLVSGVVYHLWGQEAERGNNLIMEQIHEPGGGVPGRMAPLVLGGTLLTHLGGGSAGREGTAVQMGGSLAGVLARWLRLSAGDTRILLTAGIAAGFGAVFGTPLSGAVFALEVLAVGRLSYQALIPCLIASVIGDQVTTAWGVQHTHYAIAWRSAAGAVVDPGLLVKVGIAAGCFGLASVLFAEFSHRLSRWFQQYVTRPWLRPVIGGVIVVAIAVLLGERHALGLGVEPPPDVPNGVAITTAFHSGGAQWFSWWWKLLLTAITVSSGFKGGEVTPLFYVGATLGNTLARLLRAPVDLFAGLGFVGVFAGATNTPLACTIMAIELFGPQNPQLLSSGFVVYAATCCFLSYFLSGRSTIYRAQRPAETT